MQAADEIRLVVSREEANLKVHSITRQQWPAEWHIRDMVEDLLHTSPSKLVKKLKDRLEGGDWLQSPEEMSCMRRRGGACQSAGLLQRRKRRV